MKSSAGLVLAATLLVAPRALAVRGADVVILNRSRTVREGGKKRKKYLSHKGNITKDNYQGIEIHAPAKVDISPQDIRDVHYDGTPIEYTSAKPFIQNRSFDEAIKTYLIPALNKCKRKLLRQYILYDIASCYEQMGKAEEAIKAYQRLLDEVPDTRFLPVAAERVVLVRIGRGEYDQALKLIRKLKALGPRWTAKACLLEGLVLLAKEQCDAADRHFKEIYEEHTGEDETWAPEALIGRTKAQIGLGDFRRAAEFARKAVGEAKGEASVTGEAYLALGDAYFHMAKGADASVLDEALFAYLHVPVLYEGDQESEAKALYQAGMCFKFRNERPRAEFMWKLAFDKYPSSRWGKEAQRRLGD